MEINFLTFVSNGNIKKTHELLENGINPNLNMNGYTPLTVALTKSNIDMIELLLRYGAKPNMPNSYGLTALVKSSACGYSEIVQMLLDNGAKPNLFSNGYSALVEASYHGYCDIIEILLNYGVKNVLIKGGHLKSKNVNDILINEKEIKVFKSYRHKTRNTHGTGCTLSSAITTFISCGKNIKKACELGIKYVNSAILTNPKYGKGHGPINHLNSMKVSKKFR